MVKHLTFAAVTHFGSNRLLIADSSTGARKIPEKAQRGYANYASPSTSSGVRPYAVIGVAKHRSSCGPMVKISTQVTHV